MRKYQSMITAIVLTASLLFSCSNEAPLQETTEGHLNESIHEKETVSKTDSFEAPFSQDEKIVLSETLGAELIHTDEELNKLASKEDDFDQDELFDHYGHSLYIAKSDSEAIYHLTYYGEDKVLTVLYDPSSLLSCKISSSFYPVRFSKEHFSSVTIGSTLKEVQELDPKGEYLYPESSNVYCISNHFTTEGILISIQYNRKYEIVEIYAEPLSFIPSETV